MADLIKLSVCLFAYCLMAPLWGFMISKNRHLEKATVFLLIFVIGLHIDTTVIMVGSIEWYRGVTKGYEFNLMDMLAISLIVAALLDPARKFKWLPAGTLIWLVYILCCSISIFSALETNYVIMSIFKFSKCWLLVYAVCNSVTSEHDLKFYLDAIVVMISYQCIIVIKMKYIDGVYQARGLFEHQNPLAIFTYMAILPLLSSALSKYTTPGRSLLHLVGFAAGSLIILSALSRASLAIFALGSMVVVALGILTRPSVKKFSIAALGALGGIVLLAMTLDTIISRFNDEGNQASGETREVMNLAAIAMVDDKPLGVGWNNFGKAINPPYPYGDVIDEWNRNRGQKVEEDYAKGVVESIYYLHLGENGYPGMVAFILVIGSQIMLSGLMVIRGRRSYYGDLALGIFVAFSITAIHLSLERVLTQTKNLALWMVMVGLIAAIYCLRKQSGTRSRLDSE
jgi:hypothetical protein